nr:glutaredoxin 3 [Candidatus Cardinium hertigii]
MHNITIYTTKTCPYCIRAKALLQQKNLIYTEINVEDESERAKMIEKTGGKRSVPQIFIGDQYIGGCDNLYALEKKGKLDELVS